MIDDFEAYVLLIALVICVALFICGTLSYIFGPQNVILIICAYVVYLSLKTDYDKVVLFKTLI